jgi:hypothetical protein
MVKQTLFHPTVCLLIVVATTPFAKAQTCYTDPSWCWKKGREYCSVCGVGGDTCGTVACTFSWGSWNCPAATYEQYRKIPADRYLYNCSENGTGTAKNGCKDGPNFMWCVARRDCTVGACIAKIGGGRNCTSTAGAFTGNVCGIQEKLPCGSNCGG